MKRDVRMVLITWIDAGFKMGWQKQTEALDWCADDDNFVVFECGFVFDEDDEFIVLVSGFSTDNVMNPTRINRNTIIDIKELYEVENEKA